MSINLQGHILNQRQLDAIVPVMNQLMQGKVSQKKFESACVAALEAAGCPLGYDVSMPGAGEPLELRARRWIADGRVGLSSKAIWSHMMGVPGQDMSYPRDPDDLNRCLLLLHLIPEWQPRMLEMAVYGKEWEGLAKGWNKISEAFLSEAGLDWSKNRPAPHTYALMRAARGEAS